MTSIAALQDTIQKLSSSRYWVTKDLVAVRKDNCIKRALKNVINKVLSCCCGKIFYKEISGKLVLRNFEDLLKKSVVVRNNRKTTAEFLDAFDRSTHQRYHRTIERIREQYILNLYREDSDEIKQKRAVKEEDPERLLQLLSRTADHTLGDPTATSSVYRDLEELALSWKTYISHQPLLHIESLALRLNACIHDLDLINFGLPRSIKEVTSRLEHPGDTIARISPPHITDSTLNKLRILFMHCTDRGTVQMTQLNPSQAKKDSDAGDCREMGLDQVPEILTETDRETDTKHKEERAKEPSPIRIKVINRLMRHLIGDTYPIHQLLHKVFLLQRLQKDSAGLLQNPAKREWLRSVLIHLESARQKLPKHLFESHAKMLGPVENTLKEWHQAILTAETTAKTPGIVHPKELSVTTSATQQIQLDRSMPHHPPAIESAGPHRNVETQWLPNLVNPELSEKECAEHVDGWIKYMMELRQSSLYDRLDRAVMSLAMQFKDTHLRQQFLNAIPQKQLAAWAERFYQVAENIALAHLGLMRPCLPPSRIASYLRLFLILQLLLKKDNTARFAGYNFDFNVIKFSLQDPYLDLGAHGPEISRLMQEWQSLFGRTHSWSSSELSDCEREYLRQFEVNVLEMDHPQLPTAFRCTHKAHMLFVFILNPAYTVSSGLDLHQGNFTRQQYTQDRALVEERLKKFNGDLSFTMRPGAPFILVQPLNLRYYPLMHQRQIELLYTYSTSGSITNFSHQRTPIKDHHIRNRVAEAFVTHLGTVSNESRVDPQRSAGLYLYFHQGQCFTQQAVQEEKLNAATTQQISPHVYKQLELMQTNSEDRVRNTLIRFNTHAHLLRDRDWQRVCELNCFRFETLYIQLKVDPQYPGELLAHIVILVQKVEADEIPLSFLAPFVAQITLLAQNVLEEHQQLSKWTDGQVKQLHDVTIQLRQFTFRLLNMYDKRLSEQEQGSEKSQKEQRNVRSFDDCMTYLFACSVLPHAKISNDMLVKVFRRYFWLTTLSRLNVYEDRLANISDMIDACLPRLIPLIKSQPEILTQISGIRLQEPNRWRCGDATGVTWVSASCKINLQLGTVSPLNDVSTPLPLHVRHLLGPFLSDEDMRRSFSYSQHMIEGASYYCVECLQNNRELRVFFTLTKSRPTILFMKMEDGQWYQKQSSPFSSLSVHTNRELYRSTCWFHAESRRAVFLNTQGQLCYTAIIDSAGHLQSIRRHANRTPPQEVFLSPVISQSVFALIAAGDGILVTGEGGRPTTVNYPDLQLTYQWNPTLNQWSCLQHGGYHLILAPESINRLFSRRFNQFHVLEGPERRMKILIVNREYAPHPFGADIRTRKHARQLVCVDNSSAIQEVYSFERDPEGVIHAESPEANLYLAYLYYLQEKYPQAILAMRQAFLHMQGMTASAEQISGYWNRWPIQNANMCAVKMHYSYHVYEQQHLDSIAAETAIPREHTLDSLLDLYQEYCSQEPNIDLQLRISREMHEQMRLSAVRSHRWINHKLHAIPNWIAWLLIFEKNEEIQKALAANDEAALTHALQGSQKAFFASLDRESHPNMSQIQALYKDLSGSVSRLKTALEQCFMSFSDLGFYLKTGLIYEPSTARTVLQTIEWRSKQRALLSWGLNREIEFRLKRMPPPITPTGAPPRVPTANIPLFDISLDAYCLPRTAPPITTRDLINRNLNQLATIFASRAGTLAAELAQKIIDDVHVYCHSIGLSLGHHEGDAKHVKAAHENHEIPYTQLKPDADLNLLTSQLQKQKSAFDQSLEKTKSAILHQFATVPFSLLRNLREQDPYLEDVFQQGRWCFGAQDWSSLIQQRIIESDHVATLNGHYRSYLTTQIKAQQIGKILKQIQRYQSTRSVAEKEIEGQKLIDLMQQQFRYHPENDEFAPILLLLEGELEIVCTRQQISHFIEMITYRSAFKHEAWGVGKTTVLRNLISRVIADGRHLSGLITHAPLFASNHQQIKKVTASCFGQRVFHNNFSRSSPRDAIALKREFLKLILLTERRGRIDQTMHTLLSMRHAYDLSLLNYINLPTSDSEAFDALVTFGDLLYFCEQRLVLESDELVEVVTPNRYYNYASGPPIHLDAKLYEPAFEILRLLAHSPFASYFINERHPKSLSEKQRKEFFDYLATGLLGLYRFTGISEEDLRFFWQPISSATSKADHERRTVIYKQVCAHPQANLLQTLQIFLSEIIPLSLDRTCGVHYGRSADGIHTRPYSDSAVCSEETQNVIPLLIWYSCLDYLRHGIDARVAATYVSRLKEIAQTQCSNAKRMSETPIAQAFAKNFGLNLVNITVAQHQQIAETINRTLTLRIDCLRIANFERMTVYEKRISGNARLAAYSAKEMGGSSGNSERVGTFPGLVRRVPGMMQQLGTIGRIFYNLVRDSERGAFLVYDQTIPFAEFIAAYLKAGSAYIDIAPFFAGLNAENASLALQKAMKEKLAIRFTDVDGHIRYRLPDGHEVTEDQYHVLIDACIRLFMHKDRRGTDDVLASRSSHLMGLDRFTTLEIFAQGGMRARNWGFGHDFSYVIDSGLSNMLTQRSKETGFSAFVHLFALFIENEAEELKRVHDLANQQEILAVSNAAVRQIQRVIREEETPYRSLAVLSRESGYLEHPAGCHVETLSQPRMPSTGENYLRELVQAELQKLNKWRQQAQVLLKDHHEEARKCAAIVDQSLKRLNDPKIIMEAKYLSSFVRHLHDGNEAIEAEVAVSIADGIEIDASVAIEQKVEQESQAEAEREEPRHPSSLQVVGPAGYLQSPSALLDQSIVKSFELIPHNYFLQASYLVGSQYGWWVNGKYTYRQLMAPSVLLVAADTPRSCVVGIVGNVKDADSSFETYSRTHSEKGYYSLHYKFGDPRNLDDALASIPRDLRQQAIERIVFAKLMHAGEVTFSSIERGILRTMWQQIVKASSESPERALKAYLERHFPPESREILSVLSP